VKGITTPDYYPLSLNAVVNACNQKSNRESVGSYDEDTVDETLKDTSPVALNPIVRFTALFGLLAAVFFVISAVFVYRSFYGMRIESK
jgi:hypothetical protein